MERKQRAMHVIYSKYVFLAASVALALSTLELLEVVELPFESLLGSQLTGNIASSIINFMSSNAYFALFVLMFLESASLPIPSELFLPFAGYLVYKGTITYFNAVIISSVSGLLGALVDFYIGLILGKVFVRRVSRYLMISDESLERAERWISSKGSISVFIARFVPGLRSVISFPAGILNMERKSFIITTFLGTVGWCAILIYAGISAGKLWESAIVSIEKIGNQVVLLFIAFACAIYIYYFVRHSYSRNQES